MSISIRLLAAVSATLIASASWTQAANFSFSGNLSANDDVRFFSFTLAATAPVTLATQSFGSGGFDPVLSLFDSSGALTGFSDDNLTTGSLDALIQQSLVAGSYTLALTQALNYPAGLNLAQGFIGSGVQNFGGRTSAFVLDIQNVTSASLVPPVPPSRVPDASSPGALLACGLAGLAVWRHWLAASLRR